MAGTTSAEAARRLDTADLEARVKAMYEQVALEPEQEFHFETGRALTERLGYAAAELDAIPAQAIESFAGSGTSSTSRRCEPVRRCWTWAAARAPTASSLRTGWGLQGRWSAST